MPEQKKLFLLDAMALAYRAYFAFKDNPRINSKGLNTSAVYGFTTTLLDILRNQRPTHIGVAFDALAPTMRHDDFIQYKANRESMPEDLAASLPYIDRLIEAFRIPKLIAEGYEADDIIGTLVKKAEKEGFITYMMTPDKDFGQLVSDKTFIYKPARGGNPPEILGVKEVCKKFGIERPEQVIDMLGLWGDASDNIPGIPGIGEKRARDLIARYGSMENIFSHLDDFKGKMRENLENFKEQGLQSKALATILLDAPVPFDADDLKYEGPDPEALKALFDELEFRTLGRRVLETLNIQEEPAGAAVQTSLFDDGTAHPAGLQTIDTVEHHYHMAETPEKREKLITLLAESASFCFDTETTGLDPHQAELVAMSFAVKPGEAWMVPLPENYHETQQILNEFKQVFEDPGIEKTGQNLKYDIAVLRWYDVKVKGRLFDTMLAHYLIQPESRHNMDFLAETLLNYTPVSLESLIGKKGKNQKAVRDIPIEKLKDYACEDADITLQLRQKLEPELKELGAENLFYEVETPLVPVLASMEAEGVKIDIGALNAFSAQLEQEIAGLEQKIFELAGTTFNIASPKQLGEVLFDKLKVSSKPKKTRTGQYSTSEDVLRKLAGKHPVIDHILDYRSLTKLKSTYVDTLPSMVNPRTGRIHTSFNQAVAATGRLSSNNPNLQNIPIRTERGREIRKAFVPRNSDYLLLSADYSQIELRIIAALSNDQAMLEAFSSGMDIHAATASRIFGVQPEEVTPEMRRKAKTVNFGIIYGISPFGLAERLGIARSEAAEIIDQYFRQYSSVKKWMDTSIAFARDHGYVETILGRRRYLRDIDSKNAVVRGFAERNAINAPIQGSAADLIKLAMIRIHNAIEEKKLRSRMILQVHDELVFDTHREEVEEMKVLVKDYMEHAMELNVPLVVDLDTGENWLEAH
ncbi:MAG: DNA polymerase I [Bacteroidales bacterium]